MKKFRFCYSGIVWVMLSAVLALSAFGLYWNVINVLNINLEYAFRAVSNIIIGLINLALFIFVISVMVYGRYVIKDGELISYFGFIKTKTDIKEIVQFTHFKKSNKLVAYFKDSKYTVIVITPNEYEEFILSVREINPAIIYDTKIDGEDTPS